MHEASSRQTAWKVLEPGADSHLREELKSAVRFVSL